MMMLNFWAKLFFSIARNFKRKIELPKFWAELVRVLPQGKTLEKSVVNTQACP